MFNMQQGGERKYQKKEKKTKKKKKKKKENPFSFLFRSTCVSNAMVSCDVTCCEEEQSKRVSFFFFWKTYSKRVFHGGKVRWQHGVIMGCFFNHIPHRFGG